MKKAAVIGHPIHHSKSPIIHNHWLNSMGIDGGYSKIDIPPEDLGARLDVLFADPEFQGINVTIPHKEAVAGYVDNIEETAQKIGAINTIYRDQSGKLVGTNTDAFGFIENVKQTIPAFSGNNKIAHVIGAGGAARAIVYALLEEGFSEIRLCNRTRARADSLAESFGNTRITTINWEDRHPEKDINFLVNTTSLGMSGADKLEININKLDFSTIISDIVYNPLQTELLKQGQEKGLKTVGGIGMLLHQARPAFKHFFGTMPNVDETLEKLVLEA